MKRFLLVVVTTFLTITMASATDLTGKRIYVNPGHGSFGPDDRPMATIPYPELSSTEMPDTCGFYESNTNLWKCLYLGKKLQDAGATVQYSRTECGPWPYAKVNGQYPDYSWANYQALENYTMYNRNLSEICEEVDANNIDYFISVHSNASGDGTTTNYPLVIYRGYDDITTAPAEGENCYVAGSREKADAIWGHRFSIMASGIDPYSAYSMTNKNVRGDIDFYGSSSTRTDQAHAGVTYRGYLGVLKHGASGYLVEGYFHTYQPARHRALNHDYCHQEGLAYYRGIIDYYGADPETTGYIMGTVKDLHNKIVNPLFNYAPKTNDQWMPCNGAVVTLKKGGVVVGTYNVDTLYNGIFVFENLAPGNDYTLDATCDGYKPLSDEYKTAFSVKANETTYSMIYLEDVNYTPPAVVYYNYPDPEQPAYLQLAGAYEMTQSFVGKKLTDVLADKTIRRVLYRNGSMFLLAVDAAKEPTLIEVDAESQTVKATLPTDFCSVVSTNGYKLSDIAFTADGYLVGCNYEHTAFDATTVQPSGDTGTHNNWNVYQWESNESGWSGKLWFTHKTNETAGNYYNAMTGITLAYTGTIADGFIITTATTTGSSHNTRLPIFSISEGALAGALRNHPADNFSSNDYGEARLVVSPRDDKSIIITSTKKNPVEYTLVMSTASAINPVGTFATYATGANYFKYAHHDMMVTPAQDADGNNTGIALYDITNGLSDATLIKTTNTSLTAAAAAYTMAAGVVTNEDITLYLVCDSIINKFSTVGVAQPVIPAVSAYGLNVTLDNGQYTFTFNANSDAESANLIFYTADENATQVGTIPVPNVVKGPNTFAVPADQLPGEDQQVLTWAVELNGLAIGSVGRIYTLTQSASGFTRPFVSINNSTESPYFQYLYLMDRAGASKANNGLYAFNPDYSRINTTPYKGGRSMYGSPYRTFVDDQGYIWISDGSDGYSGIIVANPADLEGTYEEFFQGTRNTSTGVITNNGVEVGSSSLGLSVYGHGADAKLLSLNEDAGTTLKEHSIAVYNIGTEEGTYKHSWSEAPSAIIELQGIAYDGYPLGCSHGVWVASRRAAGQNNTSYTALKFYDWNGNELLNSAKDPYKEQIDGSYSGAFALSPDESVLYFIDGSKHIMVWDIVWNEDTPVMTLRYSFDCGMASVREMHLDYAGNLVCSGDNTGGNALTVFTLPKSDNTTVIPARKALTVTVQASPSTGLQENTAEQYVLDENAPMYDVLGRQVDRNYRGIVIQKGQKFLRK